jgi:hypothetical protein
MATDYFYGEDNCAENYYNETYGGNNVWFEICNFRVFNCNVNW